MSDRKKLARLNKEIEKGVVKTSLHFAIAITIGTGIAKIFSGDGIGYFLFGAWITFPIGFGISFLFSMMRDKEMAAAILIEKLGGDDSDLAHPPKSITGSVVAFFLIWGVLALPAMFKDQIRAWAVDFVENSTVDLAISYEDRDDIYLKVPRPYFESKSTGNFSFSEMAWNIPDIRVSAVYPEMTPYSTSGKTFKSQDNPSVTYYTTAHSNSHRRIAIDVVAASGTFNEDMLVELYQKIPFSLDRLDESVDYGLNIKSGEVLLENDGLFKDHYIRIATPINFKEEPYLIACEDTKCVMFTYVPDLSLVRLHFNVDLLPEWRDVYISSERLLRSFVSAEPPQ